MCFFHIPLFRGQFLKLMNEKSGFTVADADDVLPMYNWKEFFYDKIPADRQIEAIKIWDEVDSYHGEKDWQERIKRRGNLFFQIVKAWVEYVERTILVVNEVEWNDIPGYKPIVDALIAEFEDREIHLHPDSLRHATVSFISNVRLLNKFVNIVFSKTYAFDAYAVNRTLEIVA
jgi:hypothetical protein